MAAPGLFAQHLAGQYGLDQVPAACVAGGLLSAVSLQHVVPHLFVLAPLPVEDAFVLSVELSAAGARRFVHQGRQTDLAPMPPGAISLTHLQAQPLAYVCSPFHSLLVHLPRQAVRDFAETSGLAPVERLACRAGRIDPVLAGLAQALLPALQGRGRPSALFLDHLAMALLAHLVQHYGQPRAGQDMVSATAASAAATLAPWQLRRAQELLVAGLGRDLRMAEVAQACRLSRSHFSRAFRQATGQPPHAWLTARRVEAAQQMLLRSTASLSEIAQACGFADQSHLTRVFGAQVGCSPARWRRLQAPTGVLTKRPATAAD